MRHKPRPDQGIEVPDFELVTKGEKGRITEPRAKEKIEKDYCSLRDFLKLVEGYSLDARLVFLNPEIKEWEDISFVENHKSRFENELEVIVIS
jgi:hypothetical protein